MAQSKIDFTLLQVLIENIPYAVFLKDAQDHFKVKLWNKAAENIFEISRSTILDKTTHDLWPKEQADQYLQADQLVVEQDLPVFIDEEESISKTRGTIYLKTKKLPIKLSPNSSVKYLLCICEDITEARSQKEENQFIIDSLGIGIWKWNIISNELEWDKNMYRLYGADPKDFNGAYDAWEKSLSAATKERAVAEINAAVRGEKDFDTSFQVVHKSGKIQEIKTKAFVIKDKNGKAEKMWGINVDRNREAEAERERERVQKELEVERSKSIRNAKLASLGEMSAGIAHEINNPLAIIAGSINLLSKCSDNPVKLAEKIATIKKSCDRIARIVTGLKKFSRSDSLPNFKNHVLSKIVKEASILTESKSKRHATPITFEISSNALVFCDEIEIEQVIVNLINNSIDAVKNKPQKWVKLAIFDDQNSVVLRITDAGSGIPENVRQKLFEPFFTTKKVGEGTGLGLSISKGILDEHKATISVVTSSPHTCFEIRFPRVNAAQNAA